MASKIIPQYLDALPGARELILVVKAFLAQRSMNEVFTGGLGSYSVICLVISFLQMHPKLRRSEMDARRNLGTLLLEFFELYGRSFNYDAVGISLRRGGNYFLKRSRGWLHQQPFLLAIEDPQDPDNDIAKSSFGIRQVKMTLSGAYDLLQNCLYDREAQIQLRNGRGANSDRRVELPTAPEDWSVLSSIMGLTKETFKFRDTMAKLYETGQVEKRLQLQRDLYTARQEPPRLQSPPPRPIHGSSRSAETARTKSPTPRHTSKPEARNLHPAPLSRGYDPVGAITVDDDSAPEDVPSSSSSQSSDNDADRARDLRSVSEDSSLWSGSGPESPLEALASDDDTRYAMSKGKKGVQQAKTTTSTKGEGGAAQADATSTKQSKHHAKNARRKEKKKLQRAALAAAKQADKTALDAAGKDAGGVKVKGKGGQSRESSVPVKAKQRPASAGPSRATTPAAVGSTAASAPASPRGGKVKRPERAAFWSAKGIAPVDETLEEDV